MTVVLKFVRGSTELSLQDGDAGIQLAEGWRPSIQIPTPRGAPAPIAEALPVLVTGSSHDDLATHIQALHQMQYWAALYLSDRMEQTPCWLHAQLYGETNERRALVYGISTTFDSGWYDAESATYMQTLMVAVTRGPWEGIATVLGEELEEAADVCLILDYAIPPDVSGDIPARINRLEIATEYDTGALDQYDRFWIGIRSGRRHADLPNFEPIWEVEAPNVVLGTETALANDATASNYMAQANTKATVTATTGAWIKRVTIELDDITQAYEDNFGRFLALLRAKVAADTKYEVQLKFAYANGAVAGEGPIVEVDESESWNYYEMGEHSIPQRDLHVFPLTMVYPEAELEYQVQIWARLTAGSGTLDLDCIIMLPIDEGYAVVKGADMDYSLEAADSAYLDIGCSPEDTFQAVALIPGVPTVQAVPQLSVENFYLPPGDGRLYIVYAGPYVSELTDMLAARIEWTPRWLSLRGAE